MLRNFTPSGSGSLLDYCMLDHARVGVCSWSLRPRDPREMLALIKSVGVRAVQLHLDPIRTLAWRADETVGLLRNAGIRLVSGMMSTKGEDYSTLESIKKTGGIRPDETWEENLRAAEGNAVAAQRMGIPLVTLHAGFIPHDPTDSLHAKMVERLIKLAEVFGARNVRIALETGQESASSLLEILTQVNSKIHSSTRVGVNFDPANMILYGMGDPIEAVKLLAPHIFQVHIKDALPSDSLGEWGVEMPVGKGSVHWPAFFSALKEAHYGGNFLIEREAGESRVEDIKAAITHLNQTES